MKVDGTRRYGAEVIFAGRTSDDRRVRAEAEAAAHGYAVVPPFDHRQIIAGAGTVGLEIVEALDDLSAVFVPVGGGGLMSGVAAAVKALRPVGAGGRRGAGRRGVDGLVARRRTRP